jgi:hypothetical protein
MHERSLNTLVSLAVVEGRFPLVGSLAQPAGVIPMNGVGPYLHWGVVQISVANFVVILLMLAIFALAIFLPFPGGRR